MTRDSQLEKQAGRIELLREIQSRLSAVPDVESATAALVLPLGGGARAKGSADFPQPARRAGRASSISR